MMGDVKEKLRRDVATVNEYAREHLFGMHVEDYVAMRQVCAALSDVLNKPEPSPESLPTGDALADDAFMCWSVGKFAIGGKFNDWQHVEGNTDFSVCRYVWSEAAAALRSRQQVAEGAIPAGWLIKPLTDGAIQVRAPDDRVEIGYRFAADSDTAQARVTYKLLCAILSAKEPHP